MSDLPKRLVVVDESGLLHWLSFYRLRHGPDFADALAAEIARRWNAHEALVAACEGLIAARRMDPDANVIYGRYKVCAIEAARAAAVAALRDAGVTP